MESKPSEILLQNFTGNTCRKYYIHGDTVLPENYKIIADSIENFGVRDDDLWIISFPRSGTTWTQEMVWNIANDLNFEGAQIPMEERIPYLEASAVTIPQMEKDQSAAILEGLENITKLPSPRIIKSHLPFDLLPRQLREQGKKSKIVYVSRNPKDTSISYYHFYKLVSEYRGGLEDFCKAFLENQVIYTPYWNHVNGFIERQDNEKILCIKYEDMKNDLQSIIKKVAGFIGKRLSDEQTTDLENHLSFSSMQKNPAINRDSRFDPRKGQFMRSGMVDQWKTDMSEELIEQFDNWIEVNSKIL